VSDDAVIAAITTLQADLAERFDGAVTTLRADLTERFDGALTTLPVAVFDRFDRVETRLTDIRGDISINLDRADRVQGSADHTRAEVRSLAAEVSTLTRVVRQLESNVHDLTRPA
jgi:hypothetical protein